MTTINAVNNPRVSTNGQLIIGSTGAFPVANTITAGSGISVTNGAGSITIAATGGASALIWLSSMTAAAASTVDFSNLLTSTYDNYFLIGENVTTSGPQQVNLRVGTGATPTWQTSNYATPASSSTSSVELFPTPNSSSAPATFGVYCTNCNSASAYKTMVGSASYINNSNLYAVYQIGGAWLDTSTAISSLRVLVNSGTISGIFKLYGLQN